MPGLGVAASTVKTVAKNTALNYAQGKLQQRASGYQRATRQPIRDLMGGRSWWQAESFKPTNDWRQIPDLSVARGRPKPSTGALRRALQQRPGQEEPAVGKGQRPLPSFPAPAKAKGTAADLGRRFHFLHGINNMPMTDIAGEIEGQRALPAGPHPGSDMRFGEGKPYGLDPRSYNLANVQEGTPWFPGAPDERLPRSAAFELGRGMLALPPGRDIIDTTATSETPKRRPAGMNPEAHKRITAELGDVAAQMEKPLIEPKRPAGGNPEAFKRLRKDWPQSPGQPPLGI